MNSIGAIVRRARERARQITANPSWIARLALLPGIVLALIALTLGQPIPARAAPPEDPAARLGFVIKSIYVRDDGDWFGKGELRFNAHLCTAVGPTACGTGPRIEMPMDKIAAGSDTTIPLDRDVPRAGDPVFDGASRTLGVPAYGGQQYLFHAEIFDEDFFSAPAANTLVGDNLGYVNLLLADENGWGIGTHNIRSTHPDGGAGDYDLTFEIRRMPLPDLWVRAFQVAGSPGSKNVCAQIENAGPLPSGPFGLTIRTDGQILNQPTFGPLAAGANTWHCTLRSNLPAKKHNLVYSIDETHQVAEMEEYNNANVLTVEADPSGTAPATAPSSAAPDPAPSPQPKPSGGKVDLIVRAIKVNGEAPDGKDDCKPGKSSVAVVIKNTGSEPTDSFITRLIVDGNPEDRNVDGLDAAQEREILFENVQLKKGERTLKAVVDAEHAVDESSEDNNERKVSARCTDAA